MEREDTIAGRAWWAYNALPLEDGEPPPPTVLDARADVGRGTLRRLFRGERTPTAENLAKLARELRVSPGWLSFGGDEWPTLSRPLPPRPGTAGAAPSRTIAHDARYPTLHALVERLRGGRYPDAFLAEVLATAANYAGEAHDLPEQTWQITIDHLWADWRGKAHREIDQRDEMSEERRGPTSKKRGRKK